MGKSALSQSSVECKESELKKLNLKKGFKCTKTDLHAVCNYMYTCMYILVFQLMLHKILQQLLSQGNQFIKVWKSCEKSGKLLFTNLYEPCLPYHDITTTNRLVIVAKLVSDGSILKSIFWHVQISNKNTRTLTTNLFLPFYTTFAIKSYIPPTLS